MYATERIKLEGIRSVPLAFNVIDQLSKIKKDEEPRFDDKIIFLLIHAICFLIIDQGFKFKIHTPDGIKLLQYSTLLDNPIDSNYRDGYAMKLTFDFKYYIGEKIPFEIIDKDNSILRRYFFYE